ncbi:DUF2141 domain-containing protein [Undibacterium terreum]|uniref:DUF2141 domain-containing protein n=1 Tax=Undibacterium terreum TaxID=1224302 RepID=A0A916XIT6_9BURK|nr:DUF2141 domain-containing protein [Undibacterium terreum]GGC73611.1 hypothetical protein GCM10011396_21000 [Undibacterium terreum]
MKSKSLGKIIATAAAMLFIGVSASSQAADITVNVKNLRSPNGALMLALFNSGEGFLQSDKQFSAQIISAAQQPAVAVFKNVPAGRYAVTVFHDENGNGKMDKNLLGIPTERYGFSNNATGTMGPPSFEQAAFTLKDNQEITIQLQ